MMKGKIILICDLLIRYHFFRIGTKKNPWSKLSSIYNFSFVNPYFMNFILYSVKLNCNTASASTQNLIKRVKLLNRCYFIFCNVS